MADHYHYAKQGDAGSVIDGVATDSIAGRSLRFVMAPIEGGTAKVAATGTNEEDDGGAEGAWSYTFTAEDLDTPGYFKAEVEVDFGGGALKTYPNDGYFWVVVTADLD